MSGSSEYTWNGEEEERRRPRGVYVASSKRVTIISFSGLVAHSLGKLAVAEKKRTGYIYIYQQGAEYNIEGGYAESTHLRTRTHTPIQIVITRARLPSCPLQGGGKQSNEVNNLVNGPL